jgi:hypothetical protein
VPPRPSAAQASAESGAAPADPQTATPPAGPQAAPADPQVAQGGQQIAAQAGPQRGAAPAGLEAGAPPADPQASAVAGGPDGSAAAAGSATGRDPAAIGAFIERFAGILYGAGMPRMPARVFAALLAADTSQLSAAELAAVLGVSPAAVSGAVRYLGQVGLAAAAGEPGSRRLSYSVPDDVWAQLVETRNTLLARLNATLLDGAALLGVGTPAGERLTRSARYFEFVLDELALVHDRWRELGDPGGPIVSAEGDTGPDGTGRDGARADGPA